VICQAQYQQIKKKYEAFFPGNLFDYNFLDETFNKQYENEQLFKKAFGIFAGLAIFVACLGLLGLTMFATIQRTKEIGIRKVLGASVSNIVVLLSKNFSNLFCFQPLLLFRWHGGQCTCGWKILPTGKYRLVDIHFSRCIRIADRISNNKFPGNKSCDRQSNKIIEN
jgi:hypothetical protein